MNILIQTPRLRIRELVAEDLEHLLPVDNDPEAMRFITGRIKTREESEQAVTGMLKCYADHGFSFWPVELKDDGTFIGWAGFKFVENSEEIELGYRYAKQFWGHGYASEAAEAILHYGFEKLGFQRIVGRVAPENIASARVLEKIGMKFEKMTNYMTENDTRYYAIEKTTWNSGKRP